MTPWANNGIVARTFRGSQVTSMFRLVVRLVIDMDETSIDIGQLFYLILQILGNVMSSPQGHVAVHDNIDLDKVVWT